MPDYAGVKSKIIYLFNTGQAQKTFNINIINYFTNMQVRNL